MQITWLKQQNISNISWWRVNSYFITLIVFVSILPFSEALVSIISGVLLGQAILMRLLDSNSEKSKSKYVLLPALIFAIYCIGLFFTNDLSLALYELKKVFFWIIIPAAIYISPKLSDKKTYIVLSFFIVSVIVASIVVTGRLIFISDTQLIDFRSASIVSHIRFSLQVILSIIILLWILLKSNKMNIRVVILPVIVAIVWLTVFLVLLKSLVGIIAFIITFLYAFIFAKGKLIKTKTGIIISASLILFVVFSLLYIVRVAYDFYNFKETNLSKLEKKTFSGNLYEHDLQNKVRENGHLVFIYFCHNELKKEWEERSSFGYEQMLNGSPLYYTLIRYMASKGLRKDSVGISKLSDVDVKNIEKGITNYKFSQSFFSLYSRVYETFWEIDYYFRTGDPNNKTLAQRIEYAKAALYLIKENPVFGIGTGNYMVSFNEAFDKINSHLLYEKRATSHNQYLNYLVKFGLAGFCIIIILLVWPVYKTENKHNYILVLFLISIAVANFGDSNLETHMGLSFFILFYSLFICNSTIEMKSTLS